MISRLPEVFGRNFAIGYLLPSIFFLAANVLVFDRFHWLSFGELLAHVEKHALQVVMLASLLVFTLGITLMALNNWIIRTKEGYILIHNDSTGSWWGRLWSRMTGWLASYLVEGQRRNFKNLCVRIDAFEKNSQDPRALKLQEERAERFPHNEAAILPFKFGNAIRAFEMYPQVMYGFEETRGWGRLLAVMPKEYREVVDGAKSQLDYLVNLWCLSWLYALESLISLIVVYRYFGFESLWSLASILLWLLGAIASGCVASHFAITAAVRWGETVKAGFDVYLPELCQQLGLKRPEVRKQEWEMWKDFSIAFVTRRPAKLPPRH